MKCERKKGERKKVKGDPTPTSMVFAPPSVPPFPGGKKPKGGSLPLGRFRGGRQCSMFKGQRKEGCILAASVVVEIPNVQTSMRG